MAKKLNIQPQTISYGAVANLLNGAFASLSGPVGFTPTQPRIVVKAITVTNPSTSSPVTYALFKGASGGSTSGTQVANGNAPADSTVLVPVDDLVLDAADFLTGECASSGGNLIVNITAEIDFTE